MHKKPARQFSPSTTAMETQHMRNKATTAQHTTIDMSTCLFQSSKYKLTSNLAQILPKT
ncbi:hypothetical protein F511_09084 [Dorcoceras hygrometricum]|nr:hypothetical protein F511_09084 [Dorcoceras hygrometricum]